MSPLKSADNTASQQKASIEQQHHQQQQQQNMATKTATKNPADASSKKKKKKQKKFKMGAGWEKQTWPDPETPVSKLYGKNFPRGECVDYNRDRNISASAEEREHRFEKDYNDARQAAEVHRHVRRWVQSNAKPGAKLFDICEGIEERTRRLVEAEGLKRGVAFPTGCSKNNCAAHYTPNAGDFTSIDKQDVISFDFGVHVNGIIIDSAFTMCWNDKYQPLLDAVKESTNAGIKEAGIDVRICDISARIQEVMESHEVELDGKTYQVKPLRNLNGHSIDRYRIHAAKTVPSVRGGPEDVKMAENEFYAIETFGCINGTGWVDEDRSLGVSHYMKDFRAHDQKRPARNANAKKLLKVIDENFGTLAFCRRYLDRIGEKNYLLALRQLVQQGIVNECPALSDVKGSYTAQYEHTFVLKPTGKEILSRGLDY